MKDLVNETIEMIPQIKSRIVAYLKVYSPLSLVAKNTLIVQKAYDLLGRHFICHVICCPFVHTKKFLFLTVQLFDPLRDIMYWPDAL